LNHPDREGRIIVPHTLIYSGLRWHVRAWCEKNSEYRDFVLSRFRGIPEIMDESEHGADADTGWNTHVTVRIAPDPRLSRDQQDVVETDYGMENGVLEVSTRARLVPYVLQLLRIEPQGLAEDPTAQQIVVENISELNIWLFG
jgi:predicted DNA-binding transcriptional regulator YafY